MATGGWAIDSARTALGGAMTTMMMLTLLGAAAAVAQAAPSASAAAVVPSFTIAHDQFVQDGKVTHLRAGCIHYSVRTACQMLTTRAAYPTMPVARAVLGWTAGKTPA